jgi:hypothetical protein
MLTNKELRQYSRFIYKHVHRFDYGWKDSRGKSRVTKESLLRCKQRKSYKGMSKLTESQLRLHLDGEKVYYYTGQRLTPFLLLCLDIDAHEGEMDAPEVAKYLARYFASSYYEPSTNYIGVHLYIRIVIPDYTTTASLHKTIKALSLYLTGQVKAQGFAAHVCGIYGLPSIWNGDEPKMAQIIKLPRPQNSDDLNRLLGLRPIPLMALTSIMAPVDRPLALASPVAPPLASPAPIVPSLPSLPSLPSSPKIVTTTIVNNQPSPLHLSEIRAHNPYYRASWTVRTTANILNRTPILEEALSCYDELELGTGPRTQKRIHRFEQAIAYNSLHFDPDKRTSFKRLYPAILKFIQNAHNASPDVPLTFGRYKRHISLEWLCVGYYFATYQLGKSKDGTLPMTGIAALSKVLRKDGEIQQAMGNQEASAVRRLLCELGLLELIDNHHIWGHGIRKGTAKKYSLWPCERDHREARRPQPEMMGIIRWEDMPG